MTGELPAFIVDHINGVRNDNRWLNLRRADASQNCWNSKKPSTNTSGAKGVSFHKATGKWQVRIRVRGKQKHIGLFDSVEEAELAFAVAADKFHGEFARTG